MTPISQKLQPMSANVGAGRTKKMWAWLLLFVAGVASLWIWVGGGGASALLDGLASVFGSLGRWAGLACGYTILLQVLLLARIPLFEKGLGHDFLLRFHRGLGITSLVLLVCHIVFPVVFLSLSIPGQSWVQILTMILTTSGMLPAIIGTVLILLVMATSMRIIRRVLSYEKWHLTHLLAYVGVGLVLHHQFIFGTDISGRRGATIVWLVMWIVAYGAMLIWRVIVPLMRSRQADLKIAKVSFDGKDRVRVLIEGNVQALKVVPGQFFNFRFLGSPGWTRANPLSLCAPPTDTHMELAVKVVGDGTRRIANLQPGSRVMIEGPYGVFTGDLRTKPHLVMLGAGTGVVPLMALLTSEEWDRGQATLVTRNSTPEDGLMQTEINELMGGRGLIHRPLNGPRRTNGSPWMPQFSDPSNIILSGEAWLSDLLDSHGGKDQVDVFVCGPSLWTQAVIRDLRQVGVPHRQVHHETFGL